MVFDGEQSSIIIRRTVDRYASAGKCIFENICDLDL